MTKQTSNVGPSAVQMIADRERAIKKILALLARKRATVVEVQAEIGMSEDTTYRYLRIMAEAGQAHRTDEMVGKRFLWALGAKPVQADQPKPAPAFAGARIVPARQVGMKRHPQDVAFFGPARGDAA